jgi:hypothetical protein
MPSATPATSTAEVNLTRVDDPNGNIPLGPPFTTTHGPEEDENGDDDALEFQGAWCCSFNLPPELRSGATITVVRPVVKSWESDDDSDHDSMPVLAPRRDDNSSDEDSYGSIPPLLQRNHSSSDDDSSGTGNGFEPSEDIYASYINDAVFPSANTVNTVWEENLCEVIDSIERALTLDTHLGAYFMPILWGYLSTLISVLMWVGCKVICGCQELLDPISKLKAIPMFFVSTLMWDSLSLFLTPSGPVASPVSRKTRRSVASWIRFHRRDLSWSNSLLFGCTAWTVMSSCIMVPSHIHRSKSCGHPFL